MKSTNQWLTKALDKKAHFGCRPYMASIYRDTTSEIALSGYRIHCITDLPAVTAPYYQDMKIDAEYPNYRRIIEQDWTYHGTLRVGMPTRKRLKALSDLCDISHFTRPHCNEIVIHGSRAEEDQWDLNSTGSLTLDMMTCGKDYDSGRSRYYRTQYIADALCSDKDVVLWDIDTGSNGLLRLRSGNRLAVIMPIYRGDS